MHLISCDSTSGLVSPQNAQASLSALIESTDDLIWVCDLDYRILTFNRAFANHALEHYGVRVAVGMHTGDILPLEKFTHWPPLVERALSEGAFRIEYSVANGRMLELSLNPIIQNSRKMGIAVFGKDITARKRMEAALRRSEEKFAKAFASSPLITTISDFNDDDRLIEVNRAFEEVVGYTREESIGRTSGELRLWNDPEEFTEAVRRFRESGSLGSFEYKFRTKAGAVRTGLISAVVTELAGKPYVLATTVDITERKRAAEENAKLENQLRQSQKMETVGRLAGGIAHDFNNLLMVINGYSQMLKNTLPADGPQRLHAEQIHKAGELAASLTRQLLTLSSNQSVKPKVLNINDIVRVFAKMLVRLIGEDIDVETFLDPNAGQIMGDPDLLHQILLNLIVNARDAMPEGGTLTVATRNMDVEKCGVAGYPDAAPGPYVLLEIKDTGVGMDRNTVQQIFEPFFTTKEKGAGTGLGLAIVYGAIKQCQGWIRVESKPGEGTSFQIHLPRLSGPAALDRSMTAGVSKPQGGETILVVEDNDSVRNLVVTILRSLRYQVLEASDSIEAFAATSEHSGEIHLLLTDLMLRGMNGNELAKKLKALRGGIKVLFMSGYPADTLGDRGIMPRQMSYIIKPFLPAELEKKVREALIENDYRSTTE